MLLAPAQFMHAAPPSPPTAPLVEMRKVSKVFDGKVVLHDLDFRVHRGETVAIIGGSGSGKSTLARILMGLEKPSGGELRVDGVDLATLDPRELADVHARFAMVFQHHALLDSLDVFDNVAFQLRDEHTLAEDEVARRVREVLRALGIEDAAKKLPAELSGGMAKRVGIARAMVAGPEILIYDEPTSGLDPMTSRTVDQLIEHMRDTYLVTSIVITHDMVSAYNIADRVVVLAKGHIVAEGDPKSIFESKDPALIPFALSSGVDPSHLSPHADHVSAAEIRARWAKEHPRGAHRSHGLVAWLRRWKRRLA